MQVVERRRRLWTSSVTPPTRLGMLWVIVIVATALGGAAGYAGGYLKAPTYTSEVQLSWDPSGQRYTDATAYVPDAVSLAQQLQNLILKVESDGVIDPAAHTLGMTSTALRESLTVTVASGATALDIDADSKSDTKAQAIAAAVVQSFSTSVSIDDLTNRTNGLRPTDPLTSSLSGQLATVVAQQDVLKAKAKSPTTPLSVLRQPVVPPEPSSLPPLTLAILGAALGLLIGLAIIALLRFRASSAARRP
jgi:uncharacterized protein involved in exopolysaccharide biosynthesis